MEFDVEIWLQEFTRKLFDEFSSRIKFVGLQGSYKRGEATENSDVDLVVILDKLSFEDLIQYKNIVHSLPFYEKADGFICGEDEIYNWPKFELFHLLNDTLPLQGNLLNFIPPLKREDIFNAIKINSADLYHKVCRGYLYENRDEEVLYQGYKSAFYILQVVYYLRSNIYIDTKRELVYSLDGEDKEILLVILNWNSLDVLDNVDFYFEKLINWLKLHI